MEQIGRVKFVQITPETLVRGEGYDPTRLLEVERLLVGSRGSFGILADGRRVMDHHHPDHPFGDW
jgi:hypothetical protein